MNLTKALGLYLIALVGAVLLALWVVNKTERNLGFANHSLVEAGKR